VLAEEALWVPRKLEEAAGPVELGPPVVSHRKMVLWRSEAEELGDGEDHDGHNTEEHNRGVHG